MLERLERLLGKMYKLPMKLLSPNSRGEYEEVLALPSQTTI